MTEKCSWQDALANLITDPKELLTALDLDLSLLNQAYSAAAYFPLRATKSYVARIKKGDINDPLLKQILPIGIENDQVIGYGIDPIKEKSQNPLPGLLHKYKNRALITLTGACAIHCRYCFRRSFPYEENNPGQKGFAVIMEYVAARPEITEVILSGGDPLVATDALLMKVIAALNAIPTVHTLRLHSRIPVVLPERITEDLLAVLSRFEGNKVLVIHANHAQELNDEVRVALKMLWKSDVRLFNQSVLLKGVNDEAEVLATLSEVLFSFGVTPYYLHLLDKVAGSAHFDLPLAKAKAIYQQLQEKVSGYLLPKLVVETPYESSKTLVFGI